MVVLIRRIPGTNTPLFIQLFLCWVFWCFWVCLSLPSCTLRLFHPNNILSFWAFGLSLCRWSADFLEFISFFPWLNPQGTLRSYGCSSFNLFGPSCFHIPRISEGQCLLRASIECIADTRHYVQIISPMRDDLEVRLSFLHSSNGHSFINRGIAKHTARVFTGLHSAPIPLVFYSRITGLLNLGWPHWPSSICCVTFCC